MSPLKIALAVKLTVFIVKHVFKIEGQFLQELTDLLGEIAEAALTEE